MTALYNKLESKSFIKTSTRPDYTVFTSPSKGKSLEYEMVQKELSYESRLDTQLENILSDAHDIAVFERRVERLRDLLLEESTALSEQEIVRLRQIFDHNQKIIKNNEKTGELILLALASLLEPLIENISYHQEIGSIVKILLKSQTKTLRYAGLNIIASGLDIVDVASTLLEEAKIMLEHEEPGYVRDYLESL
jgi:predicted Zn-ribbon and HTH transcriptional regulator